MISPRHVAATVAAAAFPVTALPTNVAAGSRAGTGNGNALLCTRAMGNNATHSSGQNYLFTGGGLRDG